MNLNNKIIEDALATIGETDYQLREAGENTVLLCRNRKRQIESGAMAFGIIEFDAELLAECPNPEFTTWAIDSFFITFKENSMVNVDDGGNAYADINLAEPDSLQRLAQAIKSGFKTIDAFYERESRTNRSDQ